MKELKNRIEILEKTLIGLHLEISRLTGRLETVEAEIYLLRKNNED